MSQEIIKKQEHGPFSRDEVIEIINSIMNMMRKNENSTAAYSELQNLVGYIKEAKMEISSVGTEDINDKHIPDATGELDAVVTATEEATDAIMDACDAIMETSSSIDAGAQTKIMDETTKIYEACSFQDITGQRIGKVVKTLKDIEEKVEHILETFSQNIAVDSKDTNTSQATNATPTDEALLNGPQMPGQGVSQDEIDALLASFD